MLPAATRQSRRVAATGSGRNAEGAELRDEPTRQLDLEMDAIGLVAALVHPAALVAERECAGIPIRNEERDPLDPRPERLVDPREERVDPLSRQRRDRDRIPPLEWVILGGGGRSLKIKMSPAVFERLGAEVVSGLGF